MSKLLGIICFGLCCWITVSQAHYEISCRFRGVFHVQKEVRYNLTSEEAKRTCLEVDAAIATKDLVEDALGAGLEICRYGWVDNNTVVIPRITPNPICAANYVGVFVLQANVTARYDVFCYNASDSSEKNCEQYIYRNTSVQSHDPTEEEEEDYTPEPDARDDKDADGTDSKSSASDGSNDSTRQKRKAAIPEWLIVCVSLVCLGLIFSVCIALNARKICGQKKKLIINGNKGSPEHGVIMEQNGDTVKSQEMVQLVSKDQATDFDQTEPLTQDEIHHEKDMKI